jgi:putative transposase
MTLPAPPSYAGYRFPPEIIRHAIWRYFRFPLSLRMVERQWARKFGQDFAKRIRRRLPCAGDKWHLDQVVLKIAGVTHWLWRAVAQTGVVLDVSVQSRRDKQAAASEVAGETDASAAGDDHGQARPLRRREA